MTTWSSVPRWLLYGATGYTGRLIAGEAVRRGHRPVLAGRSREKLEPLASALGLEVRTASLDDPRSLAAALEGLPLVLHAAGPFIHTREPMIQVCLAAGAHYRSIAWVSIPASPPRAAFLAEGTFIPGPPPSYRGLTCTAQPVGAGAWTAGS